MADNRLAIVSDAVLPFHAGGKETRHHEIASRLVDDFQVEVHTMRWWTGRGDYRGGGVRYRALCRLVPMYRGDRRSLWQAVLFALSGFRMLFRRFDVVEVDAVPVIQVFIMRLVTLLRRRRLVVTWHEVWGPVYWRHYLGRLGSLAALLERWALRLPDHIVCPSRGTADRIRSVVGERVTVTVVPNGINSADIAAVVPSGSGCDVVFVGRLISHKNIDALIRGIGELSSAGRWVTCRIVGTGPDEYKLRALAARLGLAEQVEFTGRIERDCDVIAAMKSARVFGFLSEREGFGLAVLEALACGLPVVTYDHPDNHARHLLVDGVNARMVSDLSGQSVAAALAWALDNALLLSQAAAESARAYDWAAIAGQMSKVYAR